MSAPSSDPEFVVRFTSNADTMVAMKALKAIGIKPRLLAKAHHTDHESDLCLAIERTFEADVKKVLDASHITAEIQTS